MFTGIVGTPFPTQEPDAGTCNVVPGCTIAIDAPPTGTLGENIHMTATASCNTGPAEIQWFHKVNSVNVVVQPFSPSSTLDLTADDVGKNTFFAVARTEGTTAPQTTSNQVTVIVQRQ